MFSRCPRTRHTDASLSTAAERFAAELAADAASASPQLAACADALAAAQARLRELQARIDGLYRDTFADVAVEGVEDEAGAPRVVPLDEASFAALGREAAPEFARLLAAAARADRSRFAAFQAEAQRLALRRDGARRDVAAAAAALAAATREAEAASEDTDDADGDTSADVNTASGVKTIVLVSGFESFNVKLYRGVAKQLSAASGGAVRLLVFSDRDLDARRAEVDAALAGADAFLGSLLFDFDQVEWLRARVARIPLRLAFECSLELMSMTQVGTFTMGAPPGGAGGAPQKSGPPPAVKALLAKFGSGREEDKMMGYLSFLKVGPSLLRFVPGAQARHLRNWLTVYASWNAGGAGNVLDAFTHLARKYLGAPPASAAAAPTKARAQPLPPVEVPLTGCYHPDLVASRRYIASPRDYLSWYRAAKAPAANAPVVALLLYRKHVVTQLPYLAQLVRTMEGEGLIPLPIFISGVEAHAIVRDALTSRHERARRAAGVEEVSTLRPDAAEVDAIVSTIGFPLVGGPAGSMEAGRQADVAQAILSSKNVPYFVAAPLLVQELSSWAADGVAALQSVVLYALPELDGAIDALPLGGLVGDDIFLCAERVRALAARIRAWVALRRTRNAEKRIAIVLYGFPPGSGAVGTAALLNVPRSLDALLARLAAEGYDLGAHGAPLPDGETIVAALTALEGARAAARGLAGAREALTAALAARSGAESSPESHALLHAAGEDVTASTLKAWLTFPDAWGPDEWGPIPTLPNADVLVTRMERAWGRLDAYTGLRAAVTSSGPGTFAVAGLQMGNLFIGVQPALGVEGDPMRLLFERDLTPHPQYASFYKWLQHGFGADAVIHGGMHGTAEWLPGAPLGSTALSWPEVLLGAMPNLYIYAQNNPSETIVAKRRGFGTIVSHGVPPYGRAGLYRQLADAKALLAEWREAPPGDGADALRGPIVDALASAGLAADCPYIPADGADAGPAIAPGGALTPEAASALPAPAFASYAGRVYAYLQLLENRLFSSGLHTLGAAPTPAAMHAYLDAYFDGGLPAPALEALASGASLEAARAALESAFRVSAAAAASDAVAPLEAQLAEAATIRDLLARTPEELDAIVRGLNGEFIKPAPGGDLLRDGAGALPTGRNIHALDPYRMPTPGALARGGAAARAILAAHAAAAPPGTPGVPETVSVNVWGLDCIKTKGESVGMLLEFVGAVPLREGTGRVVRFELRPLSELGGRPRVDVLANMSGIFRDSFANVVALLDDMFARAADADEPPELNFIRKHALAATAAGIAAPSSRLFSNPPGDYGSMVNERVGAGDWEGGAELGDTWAARNAFSYGRGGERGTPRPELLQALLATTERVVQTVDSVEYGLTDIQEYYANTGALLRAARTARAAAASASGADAATATVGCSIVEAFGPDGVPPRELDATLRLEYRTKLLSPRWAEAMAAQGSGGAYEISQRMTALVGWGATAGFADAFVYDGAYETYVEDAAMAAKLRAANPAAWANVVKRMLEAAGRGLWDASPERLAALRALYADADEELERAPGAAGKGR
jgi:magnesium chelatase subunit H